MAIKIIPLQNQGLETVQGKAIESIEWGTYVWDSPNSITDPILPSPLRLRNARDYKMYSSNRANIKRYYRCGKYLKSIGKGWIPSTGVGSDTGGMADR